jgi:hypothetical protein
MVGLTITIGRFSAGLAGGSLGLNLIGSGPGIVDLQADRFVDHRTACCAVCDEQDGSVDVCTTTPICLRRKHAARAPWLIFEPRHRAPIGSDLRQVKHPLAASIACRGRSKSILIVPGQRPIGQDEDPTPAATAVAPGGR